MGGKMENKKLNIIKETAERLLKLLQIEATVEVLEDQQSGLVNVQIKTPEQGILIGYHGETLSALQLILGVLSGKRIGEWVKLTVNVGDYRQKREETLQRMALSAAQRAQFSGQPVVLENLSPPERRVIHLALSGHSEVETTSEGEGRERKLVIRPRK